jgi:hypothetical protein
MATTTTPTRRTRFSRRIPDHVTDELVNVLSKPRIFEFNELFGLVYENLKKRNAVSGGEEMLRLRAYEKLQNLVSRSLVEKVGKTYRGLEGIKSASSANQPKPVLTPSLAVARAAALAAGTALTAKTVSPAKPAQPPIMLKSPAKSAAMPGPNGKTIAKAQTARNAKTTKAASAKAVSKSRIATTRSRKRAVRAR